MQRILTPSRGKRDISTGHQSKSRRQSLIEVEPPATTGKVSGAFASAASALKRNKTRNGKRPSTTDRPLAPPGGGREYSLEELNEYRQVFSMFDADGSGSIGIKELADAMKRLGMKPSQKELETIIHEVDQDGNGEIDFDEFCDVMRRLSAKKGTLNEVVRSCFQVFDRSENGCVSQRDFQFVLKKYGEFDDAGLVDEIFTQLDVDGNGVIDYDEFSAMVSNYMTAEDVDASFDFLLKADKPD